MIGNRLFPLKIVPENTEDAFKAQSKEQVAQCDKKENDIIDFQDAFQNEVQDNSSLWDF